MGLYLPNFTWSSKFPKALSSGQVTNTTYGPPTRENITFLWDDLHEKCIKYLIWAQKEP